MIQKVQVLAGAPSEARDVLTGPALSFVSELALEFEDAREELLLARQVRARELAAGSTPDFLPETMSIRDGNWQVVPAPEDLQDRRVEITGPASDRKMVINALNSGARVFMADFEDAHAPGWIGTLEGQQNLYDAVRRTIAFINPDGKRYSLTASPATLTVRPRGLHLLERHISIDGQTVSASLFDFGVYLFHNAHALLEGGSGPYFYLPKLQGYMEARWWRDVFAFSEDKLALPKGAIRATVLIEHILAAFEMEEILYELRDHITGLNLGRWDYIFSYIKAFHHDPKAMFPDRAQVTMTTDFLRSAAELLAQQCHRRGAHALGGMSAFIPRKDDPKASEKALAQIRTDKQREAAQGYDGAWVAHPGLVQPVFQIFEQAFPGPNQLDHIPEVKTAASDLLSTPEGEITETGFRNNVSVALQYLEAWVEGRGAVAINGLMEDTATAEIARAQLWQWNKHGAHLHDGRPITLELYQQVRSEEIDRLLEQRQGTSNGSLDKAAELLDELVTSPNFIEFLTIPGYKYLD